MEGRNKTVPMSETATGRFNLGEDAIGQDALESAMIGGNVEIKDKTAPSHSGVHHMGRKALPTLENGQ